MDHSRIHKRRCIFAKPTRRVEHTGDFSIPAPIVTACGLSFSSSGANRTILCSVLLVYHQMLPVTDILSTFPNREVNASPLDGKSRYINHYADNLSVIMTYTKS